MDPSPLLIHRRLLQDEDVSGIHFLSPADADDDDGPPPAFRPVINGSSTSSAAAVSRPFNPTSPFDSSMALTILVLLTALFFMGFFSVYIRRFTAAEDQSSPSPTAASRSRPPPPNRKGGGLDPSAVSSLPLVAYGRAAKHPMIDDCPICLSEFQETETVKLIPYCGHVFHPTCVDTWLSSHVTCPLCRSAQLFERVEEVCLDVKQERNEFGASEIGERSTVENADTL
ncbi:UNVERIFIED_CONTAM: RING-H2 finger protein ATL57 [Sesamum angustifolium]|uniref:RING-type E3 ubiquitin transferase n=1 Tax=Sesamum angustifolium TaxID=2727405 RepID=A0AAW2QQA8_9LAMI